MFTISLLDFFALRKITNFLVLGCKFLGTYSGNSEIRIAMLITISQAKIFLATHSQSSDFLLYFAREIGLIFRGILIQEWLKYVSKNVPLKNITR